MKILHIIDTLGIGGAETLLVNTINALPKKFENHVIYLSQPNDLIQKIEKVSNVVNLNFRGKIDFVKSILKIKEYIIYNNIEIVHSHLVLSTIIARAATPNSVKLISTLHSLVGSRFFSSKFSLLGILEKIFYKKSHILIGVSKEVLENYAKYIHIKGKSFILKNFVPTKFFNHAPKFFSKDSQELKLVSVGSLKEPKNYSFLIDAMKHLPQNITLDIYGEGPLRNDLEKQISQLKVKVNLMGNANVLEVLRKYDLFVMCSLVEGHPIALIEAMAMGMPAIVSDIPVLREAMGNQGFFFSLEDSNELINTILDIQKDKTILNAHSRYNYNKAIEVSSEEQYIKKLLSIYSA